MHTHESVPTLRSEQDQGIVEEERKEVIARTNATKKAPSSKCKASPDDEATKDPCLTGGKPCLQNPLDNGRLSHKQRTVSASTHLQPQYDKLRSSGHDARKGTKGFSSRLCHCQRSVALASRSHSLVEVLSCALMMMHVLRRHG